MKVDPPLNGAWYRQASRRSQGFRQSAYARITLEGRMSSGSFFGRKGREREEGREESRGRDGRGRERRPRPREGESTRLSDVSRKGASGR